MSRNHGLDGEQTRPPAGPSHAEPSAPAGRLPPIDFEAFAADLRALRAEIDADLGPGDLAHLQRIERWGRLSTAFGYATAWVAPNPLSAALLALGSSIRWTVVAHHVQHRALDGIPGVPLRYTSEGFAEGRRRAVDWLDWIHPAAWRHEHNVLHHACTGERADPDLVEDNIRGLREASWPLPVKYAVVALLACTWKVSYYAPNTFLAQAPSPKDAPPPGNLDAFDLRTAEGRRFWTECLLPYVAVRFCAAPLAFAPLGPWASASVLVNSLFAEVLTNLHTFLLIAPNHTGSDLYRFTGRAGSAGEYLARQVASSTNFETGGDVLDTLQGFLNYQIEHHLFPDLPPRRYREIQPRVKAICEARGVPYVQESVFKRVRRLVDVMVGKASMRVAGPEPRRAAAPRAPVVAA